MKPNFRLPRASLKAAASMTLAGTFFTALMAAPASSAQRNGTPFAGSFTPSASASFKAEMPQPADSFVDMLGVNVHLHYTRSPYATAYPSIKSLLLYLGARHIRDGVINTSWQTFYDRLNDLGRSGIKSTLTTDRSQSAALLLAYPKRVASSIEAYEAPNEQDIIYASDPSWPQKARAFQSMLFKTVHGHAQTQYLRVLGPAIGGSKNTLMVGNISSDLDVGNFHEYFAGFNPGTPGWGSLSNFGWYGSMDTNINIAKVMAASKPLEVTETGYNTGINARGNVPLSVQAKYAPRLLLEMFNRGVKRAFIYELIDNTTSPGTVNSFQMGLATSALQPKASLRAIANLNALLAERGASFRPTTLTYALQGNVANVHHLLLQKHDGTYYLVLWIEQPSWHPANSPSGGGSYISIPAQRVTVALAQRARGFQFTTWQPNGGTATASAGPSASTVLAVSDSISVLHIVP